MAEIGNTPAMAEIGKRLKIERSRLNLRQIDVARLTHVSARAQCKYEAGQQEIRLKYLARLADLGFDVHYLITGQPNQVLIDKKEHRLLAKYRQTTPEVRQFLERGLMLEEDI